jgi:FtsH-binding integral membrane protein
MVDIFALGLTLLIVVAVFVRKTSAGVAILGLLAGVLLDQLLSGWIFSLLPPSALQKSEYVPVAIHLIVTLIPVVAIIATAKVSKPNPVLSLLTSLVLGFLVTFFVIKIVAPLPVVADLAKNSGLLHFLQPYQNAILASGATLALVELISSHGKKQSEDKKKK